MPARWSWRPGTTFVPTPDGWLVHGPDEDFMVLDVPPEDRDTLAALIGGDLDAAGRLPGAADLLDELAEQVGHPGMEVLLLGDGPLTGPLSGCLERAGFAVRHAREPEPGAKALVACAEHLPDSRWRTLGERCRDEGIAWHRGHSEGRRWYVGPFTPPSGGPDYEDVRLRRLAACPWPDELAAYWAYLDGGGRPVTPADPAGAVVAAALICADLRAWRDGEEPPGLGHQIGVDLEAARLTRHPVLAVPRGLMREVPA